VFVRTLLVLTIALGFVSSAFALTLKEKQYNEMVKKTLSDPGHSYVKSFKDKCGYDLPVAFEEKMIKPFMEANTRLYSFCDAPRGTLSGMCEDATAKTAIKEKIKKVSCKLGKADEKSLKLVNGELQWTVGLGASNLDDFVKNWTENNL
jgi:hypothetical protein